MRDQLQVLKASVTERVRIKQKVVFYGVFTLLTVAVVAGFVYKMSVGNKRAMASEGKISMPHKRIRIESGGSVLNEKEIWVNRLENSQEKLNKKIEALEKIVKELASYHLQESVLMKRDASSALTANEFHIERGERHHNRLDASSFTEQGSLETSSVSSSLKGSSFREEETPQEVSMQRITFDLDPMFSKKVKRSVDHYVPAGSFVRGRLVSGVVASTAVQASANPQPVHLELTNLGNLPRGFKADVAQCFLIGSAYGDLSSERVLMRLENLSCVERKTGEVIELEVDGFVTGEDGANGVRGILVDRSGPVMRNAFIGGFLSGIGGFFGQQQTSVPTVVGAGGVASFNPLGAQKMIEGGAGKGIGNAMEKLSDFYIKRAEQLQPVLEVEPGRLIHVVFKKGFDMNQTLYRQSVMNVHDAGRREVAGRVSEMSIDKGE